MTGIVLYGPPASGKTTITTALTAIDRRFTLLRKLKAGNRRGSEYEFTTPAHLAELRTAGRLVAETHRYGNTYAIDRHQIAALTDSGKVPVVHMGNIPDTRRLIDGGAWLTVLLWISREECERRSISRGDPDTAGRLHAWDETLADLNTHGHEALNLHISTEDVTPDEAAEQISKAYQEARAMNLTQEL
ncbi:guanylate kinase [Acrocarpospora catenulata]|uniref:guanylate kinase n=1 Tax=Acrocarpospora catenulata TaxID=2836182 RepID=UPI001BD9DEBD|nr:guanylate kinase [Acrocarpospora catenulata]